MRPGALLRPAWPWWTAGIVVTAAAAWLPLFPSLEALASPQAFTGWSDPRLGGVMLRTLWISASAAALSVLLGFPLALLARRTDLPGARLFELLLPLPLLLPPLLLALLAARALARQGAQAHEAAFLAGGQRLALGEMVRSALPAAALGGALSFLFTATDFAVPDYFASVGERFDVYANVVFNAWRDWKQNDAGGAAASTLLAGTRAAAPLLLLAAAVFYAALSLRDRLGEPDPSGGRPPARLRLGAWRVPFGLLALCLAGVLLLLPLGRIVFETGSAGPLAAPGWLGRSADAFSQALQRGRGDLLRSLLTGCAAAGIAAFVAPLWAHRLIRLPRGPKARLLTLILSLSLLAPAVGVGIGAILVYNSPFFGDFYLSQGLPALILAGRFLPVAVFLLAERMQRVPREQEEAAALAGAGYPVRLFRYLLGPNRGSWLLAAGLVAVFSVRELDLAILLPASNASAAVRYYNALHFARDNFVAAFGLIIALILFLPVMLSAAWKGLHRLEGG
ncbi:MAG: hypothetical protein ACE5H3_09100 [Planctomycetota bacterium]